MCIGDRLCPCLPDSADPPVEVGVDGRAAPATVAGGAESLEVAPASPEDIGDPGRTR